MRTPAIEQIETILSGESNYPFDFINNPIFFDPKFERGTDHTERLLAQSKLGLAAYSAVSRGVEPVFGPGTMSNGWYGLHLILDNKDDYLDRIESKTGERYLTLQNPKYYLAPELIGNEVTEPARLENHSLGDSIERLFPGRSTIVPIDAEGPSRNRKDNALSQGASFQDWTYEFWWVPIVMKSSGMALGNGHAHSWNGNHEEITGDLIQLGFLDHIRDHQAGKDFDIVDAETGEQIPLADRAWETAKHILYATEKGFRSPLAIAAFAIRDQADEWLRNGDGPVDGKKVHPVLAERSTAELRQMDKLKKTMRRYIAENCADWLEPYFEQDPHLKSYFENYILPETKGKKLTAKQKNTIEKDLFAYRPRGGFRYPGHEDAKEAKPSSKTAAQGDLVGTFSSTARQVKRRGSTPDYFESGSRMFDDESFKDLSPWERAALKFMLPFMETFRLPEEAPRTAFFAAHPKGGKAAGDYAEKHGVTWVKEARAIIDPTEDDSFYNEVEMTNLERDVVAQEDISSEDAMQRRGVQQVVSTLDMIDLRKAAEKYRFAIASKGEPVLSPRAFLTLQLEWFRRNASSLVVRPGWENHPDEVQFVVEALKIATGLSKEPYPGAAYRMEIFEYDQDAKSDRMRKLNLFDIAQTLGNRVESYLDGNKTYIEEELGMSIEEFAALQNAGELPEGIDVPAPAHEEIVAMARVLKISDMLADPGRVNYGYEKDRSTGHISKTHEIIDWRMVDNDLTRFWYREPQKRAELSATSTELGNQGYETMRDRLRRKLLDVGVLQIQSKEDLNGLDNGIDDSYEKAWLRVHNQDTNLKRHTIERRTLQRVRGPAGGSWGGGGSRPG